MRFRVSYQHDSMQCGAACLRMVCKHYGKEYALDFLSEQCGCMIDGVSLQAIRETAEDLGFRTFAVSVGLSELQAGWCPCILHWERNHLSSCTGFIRISIMLPIRPKGRSYTGKKIS